LANIEQILKRHDTARMFFYFNLKLLESLLYMGREMKCLGMFRN